MDPENIERQANPCMYYKMKLNRYILIGFQLSILCLLFRSDALISAKQSTETRAYLPYVHETMREFSRLAKKKFDIASGGGGGQMPYDVEQISIFMNAERERTLEEARILSVQLLIDFGEIVNRHEKLRPYLREYPFPPNRLAIMLGFNENRNGRECSDRIAFVCCTKGNLDYYLDHFVDNRYINVHTESYETAFALVEASLPLAPTHIPIWKKTLNNYKLAVETAFSKNKKTFSQNGSGLTVENTSR